MNKDKLVAVGLIWLAGVLVGLFLINQIGGPGQVRALDGAISAERRLFALFGGAIALGLLQYARPQVENKILFVLSLAAATGAIGPDEAKLIYFVVGAVAGFLVLIVKGFIGKEAPAKPAAKPAAQAPQPSGSGVEFRARVEQTGGVPGLDQLETLTSISTEKPESVQGQLATQLTQAVLARSLMALGVQPRITRPEPEPTESEGLKIPELRRGRAQSPFARLLRRK